MENENVQIQTLGLKEYLQSLINYEKLILSRFEITGLRALTEEEYSKIFELLRNDTNFSEYTFHSNKNKLKDVILEIKKIVNRNGYDLDYDIVYNTLSGLVKAEFLNGIITTLIHRETFPIIFISEDSGKHLLLAIAPRNE